MIIKGIIEEDSINYKKTSMIIEFPYCSLKCDRDCGKAVCQNSPLLSQPDIEVSYDEIAQRYLSNPITKAIVLQGMEPIDSITDVLNLIAILRIKYRCYDDIVIYTGYKKEEIMNYVIELKKYNGIIIKYGRYIPDQEPHYDEVLGVNLASNNQYAERL